MLTKILHAVLLLLPKCSRQVMSYKCVVPQSLIMVAVHVYTIAIV